MVIGEWEILVALFVIGVGSLVGVTVWTVWSEWREVRNRRWLAKWVRSRWESAALQDHRAAVVLPEASGKEGPASPCVEEVVGDELEVVEMAAAGK
jgi:hypothetical protein